MRPSEPDAASGAAGEGRAVRGAGEKGERALGTDHLLRVADLSIDFHSDEGRICAVDAVSFELRGGEVLAVVGESGCGKSVMAMSLTGLLPRSARVTGSVRLDAMEVVGAPAATLRHIRGRDIAYVFQEPMSSLNPVFTVGRQIVETLRTHERYSRAAAARRAAELLDLVGISSPHERLKQYPHQLSGGLRQRVMIAMAVACNPRVIVADEPTTALDVTIQAAILDLLRDLRARLGTAVLLITHDLGVVADVADRVLVMYAGRIVESGSVRGIFRSAAHPYTRGLLRAIPAARRSHRPGAGGLPRPGSAEGRLAEIPGLVPALADRPDSCTFADRCGSVTDTCRRRRPPWQTLSAEHGTACFHPAGTEA